MDNDITVTVTHEPVSDTYTVTASTYAFQAYYRIRHVSVSMHDMHNVAINLCCELRQMIADSRDHAT